MDNVSEKEEMNRVYILRKDQRDCGNWMFSRRKRGCNLEKKWWRWSGIEPAEVHETWHDLKSLDWKQWKSDV